MLRCGFGRLRVTKVKKKGVSKRMEISHRRRPRDDSTVFGNSPSTFTRCPLFVVLGKVATTGATRRDATGDDAGVQVHASRARQRVRDVAPRGRPSPGTVRGDASARSRISAESRPNGNFAREFLAPEPRGSTPSVRRHPPTWRLTSRPGARWACPRAGGRLPTFPRRRPPLDALPRAVRPRAGPARHPVAGRRCPARTGPCAPW